MRLLSWMVDGAWSATHISHIGEPLCDEKKPEEPQATRERPAEIRDWSHICSKCREVAVRGATDPIEADVVGSIHPQVTA